MAADCPIRYRYLKREKGKKQKGKFIPERNENPDSRTCTEERPRRDATRASTRDRCPTSPRALPALPPLPDPWDSRAANDRSTSRHTNPQPTRTRFRPSRGFLPGLRRPDTAPRVSDDPVLPLRN